MDVLLENDQNECKEKMHKAVTRMKRNRKDKIDIEAFCWEKWKQYVRERKVYRYWLRQFMHITEQKFILDKTVQKI